MNKMNKIPNSILTKINSLTILFDKFKGDSLTELSEFIRSNLLVDILIIPTYLEGTRNYKYGISFNPNQNLFGEKIYSEYYDALKDSIEEVLKKL
jgi:hypothetical protein